jgi:TetR/AcrR family transcriptional regulator, transcriptional repressor for nem operon
MHEAPKTARGRATRERIVTAARELIAERGVAETSVDDVIDRAGASKSQLYHYFDDRAALLRAVIDHNAEDIVGSLGPFDSWAEIRRWLDSVVEANTVRCRGCPLGSLVPQLAQTDERARAALAASLARWTVHLSDGLRAMQAQGKVARRADPDRLATATLAAIQGGLVLTQATRDPQHLATAADAAYDHLRAHASSPRAGRHQPAISSAGRVER